MTLGDVSGKAVLVTGGGAGMGQAIARRLHDGGASVAILEIDAGRLEDTRSMLGDERFTAVLGDVADPAAAEHAVAATVEAFGRVDVVCNNAGILGEGTVHETTPETWDRVLAVNLTGMWHVCRAAIPRMLEQGGGTFVNTASVGGMVGGAGDAAYVVSKHGVLGLTRQIAVEYGHQGIRANALCPGPTATPMTEVNRPAVGPGPYDDFIASMPVPRWAEPDEMARVVQFLASDDASYATGAAWVHDGGWVAA
jgi:NAD(P)-dependent dehydrogenase (short-subunit alcohol dehydrogenase family)